MTPPHHHEDAGATRSALGFAVGLTALTFAAEVVGGFYSHSLALLSDAGHVLMDLTALLFARMALSLADRPPSVRRTFGLHRVEVLAALTNGGLVIGLAIWIFWESLGRVGSTAMPRVVPMGVLGAFGLLINLLVAKRLHGFSRHDVNLRAAFLHVASDALASVGVLLGAFVIYWTGWVWVDPLVGVLISMVIFANAGKLVRDALNLLLEGVPRHLRLKEVEETIRAVPGVSGVEDLHVWGLCSHFSSLSAHVKVRRTALADPGAMLKAINAPLRDRFLIAHTTLQLEPDAIDSSKASPPAK